MSDSLGYYARLGVDPSASSDQIKAAYRRKAKELHPDQNPDQSAAVEFAELGEAYRTLSDPEQRLAYDKPELGSEERAQPPMPVVCSRCKKVTAQPRFVRFYYAVSVVLVTLRRPIDGVFCASCARIKGVTASILSGVFGWWGVPWGPIWTISTIYRNAQGGDQSRAINDALLWESVRWALHTDNIPLAYGAARRLVGSPLPEVADAANRLCEIFERENRPQSAKLVDAWEPKWTLAASHLLAAVLLPGILVALFYLNSGSLAASPSVASPPVFPRSTLPVASEVVLEPECQSPPANGALVYDAGSLVTDGHRLEISNGNAASAIVNLRLAEDNRLVAALFVERSATAAVEGIPDGTYRIQYAIGERLAEDCASFSPILALGEFPSAEVLNTTVEGNYIVRQELTYTLYEVTGGNIRPNSITAEEFLSR